MTKEKSQNYKICILDENGLPKYYLLFVTDKIVSNTSGLNTSGLESSSISVSPKEFFSNVEWDYIQEKKIEDNIFICNSFQIHSDDSVQILKKKIKKELQNYRVFDEISDHDMYLFVTAFKTFQPLSIYKRLTKQDSVYLTKPMLNQFMMNYYGLESVEPDFLNHPLYLSKNEFVYEDLLEFEWFYGNNNDVKPKKIPLGFRFIENKTDSGDLDLNQDLFASNPFDMLFPNLYFPSKDVLLQSFHLDFLFRYGDFIENTIYVCLYTDVKSFLTKNNMDYVMENDLLNIYFPYHETNMNIMEENQNQNQNKMEKRENSFWEEQTLIDTIYSISTLPTKTLPDLDYKSFGISQFHFIIHPENTNQLPLETIFKNIHVSIHIPMIQYNPGLRREKIYRLYYQQIAQNGNKIPFLKKTTIEKLMENPGKIANITMFILTSDTSPNFIQVSFESNGNISVKGDNIQPMMPEVLNEWLKLMINPAIQTMNEFTQSSGYSIHPFEKIQTDNIEIISLQYNATISNLKKKIDLDKYMGIFSPFFYNEISKDKKKEEGIYKRYKRIEYFQRMNLHEEYISELLRLTQNKKIIQKELWKRFRNESDPKLVLSFEQAEEILNNYADKHRNALIPSRYTNNNIEILEHTGFRTIFRKSDFDNEWLIEIQNVIHLEYIYLLHIYLNTLFRISQHPEIIPANIFDKYKGTRVSSTPIPPSTSVTNVTLPTNISFLPMFTEDTDKIMYNVDAVEKNKEMEEEEEEDGEFILKERYESEEEEEEEGDFLLKERYASEEEKDDSEIKGGKKGESDEEEIDEKKQLKTLSNYFTRRIKKRNPLFSKSGFARACPANEKRHPIILTNQEKQKIDEEFPDPKNRPYGHSLKYGKDDNDNPLHYICPSYWCIKPGQEGPLTETDVENKKCGEIIKDPKKIKPGEYTYKWREGFNDPGVVNRKIKKDMKIDPNTGKDICYPCCFQNWHGKIQNERRFKEKCLPDDEQPPQKKIAKEKKIPAIIPSHNVRNILGINWIPLPYGRIGLLQFPIQLFLNATTSNLCVDAANKPKLNCPILVRYGVVQPNYNNQYFLGCLADIYAYQHRIHDKIITIPEIRDILCNAISLDKFVLLHNATLVSLFRYRNDDFLTIEHNREISVSKYENTLLFKRLNLNLETHMDFLKSTILSYEHFLQYLRDDTIVIDHTYLWEIICERNPVLLPQGLNMVILEITNHDITNNVDIVCPTSVYNFQLYDPLKETLLLVKQNEIYEPVYLYEITSLNPEIVSYKKTFLTENTNNKDIMGLHVILKMIQSWTLMCTPSQKKKNMVFTQNITADKILGFLREISGYSILYQILNYQHKIIGFVVKKRDVKKTFFLPVFPSSAFKNIPTKWMDEPDIWNNYETSVHLLKELYLKSNKNILCQPLFRVIEDEKIVGIITMTNQFIQIMPYEDNRDFQDGLKNIDDTNYIVADMDVFNYSSSSLTHQKKQKVDFKELSLKEKTILYIKLESQFYSAFRNTIRLLLNLYKSRKTREKIQELIFDKNLSFSSKLKQMKHILLEFMNGLFSFQEYDEEVLSNIRDVFICQQDNTMNEPYCLLQEDAENPVLILPKYNLLNRSQLNEMIYFTKIADELIRYKRVRLFMLYPDNYLHISNTEYNIHAESEFIIPKSELNKTFFSELEPYALPKYVNTNTYETAIPVEKYANPTQVWTDKYSEMKRKNNN
jgi:hypothetical protein